MFLREIIFAPLLYVYIFSFSPMLDQLFGSKTRVRLLRLFLHNPEQAFFVRQLSRKIGAQINGVRNELDNLVDLGLVSAVRGKVPEEKNEEGETGDAQHQQKKLPFTRRRSSI